MRIQLDDGIVAIPWGSRQQLLAECAGKPPLLHAYAAFRGVGTSRPVRLLRADKVKLLELIESWAQDLGGYQGLPAGISGMRDALRDDIDNVKLDG